MNLWNLMDKLKRLSDFFFENGIYDIYTNSKIYEVLIATQLGHSIINGHAYSSDARDENYNIYEYKHYKKSSSNHTWTFNDFTKKTITRLYRVKSVYFVVIDDKNVIPEIEKIYIVSGREVAEYLEAKRFSIRNHRWMMNISAHQIIEHMSYKLLDRHDINELDSVNSWRGSIYQEALNEIFITAGEIEKIIQVDGILTSNKLWELLVACKMGHRINSEQKKHDAYDLNGRTYEYKVSVKPYWVFQDISNNVLESYLNDEKIILALVDKRAFDVKDIIVCQPEAIVKILHQKLARLQDKFKRVRRLSSSIGVNDVRGMLERGEAECIPRTYL